MSQDKPKRFDKFKGSLHPVLSEKYPSTKRSRTDTVDSNTSFSKRICRELPAQPTKNLANSRLQKIKEKLKLELLADPSTPKSFVVNSRSSRNDQPNVEISPTTSVPKNVYQNLEKWATPPDPSQNNKNLANQRMGRLKKLVQAASVQNEKSGDSSTMNTNIFRSGDCTLIDSNTSAVTLGSPVNTDNQHLRDRNSLRLDSESSEGCASLNKTNMSPLLHQSYDYRSSNIFNTKNISKQIFALPSSTQQVQFRSNSTLFKMPNSENHRSPLLAGLKSKSTEPPSVLQADKHVNDAQDGSSVPSSSSFNTRLDSHRSLFGLKRPLSDDTYECTSPKRKLPDLVPIQPLSRKTSTPKASNDKSANSVTPSSNKMSERLDRYKKISDSPIRSQKTNKLVDKTVPSTPVASTSHSTAGSSKKVEPGDSYLARMKRTALWVQNICGSSPEIQKSEDINISKEVDLSVCSKVPLPDEDEEMEWTNAEPDDEKPEIKDEATLQRSTTDNAEEPVDQKQEKQKNICVVVDTNIFISNLSKVKDILSLNTPGSANPILYIPWMVITELDYMKDGDHCKPDKLKNSITKSIKFINTCLKEKHPRVIAQSVFDVEKQKQIGTSQDDKIISCCLQVAEKYETVILLSNDTNLKNKAMINTISACSANEIIMKIMSKLVTSVKFKRIEQKMSVLCSSIICECAKETYGDVWSKMDLLSCPPWSFLGCLKRFTKYWGTIFRDKLMKQCTKTLEELTNLLTQNKCIADDSGEYEKFVKLCITFGVYLKDIESCRGSVSNTLKDITLNIS